MLTRNGAGSKKGQVFLLGAIAIAIMIVILRYNVAYPTAVGEKKALETRFENHIFNNLIKEFNNTLRFSYDKPLNITYNVFDFANFTKTKITEHSMNFKFLFVGSVANETTGIMNVSLINVLGDSIDANLTFDGQSDAESDIQNYEKWDTNFTITPGTTYTLILSYDSIRESITIKTRENKDVYVGFVYVSLESAGGEAGHRMRYQKSMALQD